MSAEESPSAGGEVTELTSTYQTMREIRSFEETVSRAHKSGELPGLLHLSWGGEGVAAGVIGQLRPSDRVYSGHRGHGHFLAAGVEPYQLMAELAGREDGICRGRGGSMHLMATRAVMATGVVGGTLPIAVGHALAMQGDDLCVVFFGDGAVQTGTFHETLNIASLWGVRTLFVCENNGWAEFSSREEHTKVSAVASYGSIYGLPATRVDGSDVRAVIAATRELVGTIRSRGGPGLLECVITRMGSHYEGDLRRSIDSMSDPLQRLRAWLIDTGADPDILAEIDLGADRQMKRALEAALGAQLPDPHDDLNLVFERPLR